MMDVDKSQVKQRFRRSAATYESHAHVQKLIVARLYALLRENVASIPGNVLEIGCGTGLLTRKLNLIPRDGEFYINDLVEEMCARTASTCGFDTAHCLVGDVEEIDIPGMYELVASASTFQWFQHPKETIARIAKHLVPGGWLAISTFGTDNLHELRSVTGAGLQYLPEEMLCELLAPWFEVKMVEQTCHTLTFSAPIDVLHHLKLTGVNATATPRTFSRSWLNAFSVAYEDFRNLSGEYPLTYQPLTVMARRRL